MRQTQYSMPIDNQRDAAELRPEDLLCKSRAV